MCWKSVCAHSGRAGDPHHHPITELKVLASSPLPVHAGSGRLLARAPLLRSQQAPAPRLCAHLHCGSSRAPQRTMHVQLLRSTSRASRAPVPALPARTKPIHPNRLLYYPCSCTYRNPTSLSSHQQHAPCAIPVHTFARMMMVLSFISAPRRESGRKEHATLPQMISILHKDQAHHPALQKHLVDDTPPTNSHRPLQDFSFPPLCADSRNPL